jgi:hypothetical protein
VFEIGYVQETNRESMQWAHDCKMNKNIGGQKLKIKQAVGEIEK